MQHIHTCFVHVNQESYNHITRVTIHPIRSSRNSLPKALYRTSLVNSHEWPDVYTPIRNFKWHLILPHLNSVHSVDVLGSIFAFIKLENTTKNTNEIQWETSAPLQEHLSLTFLGKRQPSSYSKKTSNYVLPTFKNISHTKSGEKNFSNHFWLVVSTHL